jgi:superfamily II DNA or RNA helicase
MSDLAIAYEGSTGHILSNFVIPVLSRSQRYDRLTSFFNVGALVAIAEGLDKLRASDGSMRLVLGVHAVPKELADATVKSESWASTVVSEVRKRLIAEASSLQDEFRRDRLAAVAWMIKDGLLKLRVAVPRTTDNLATESIFHSKRFIFTDSTGHVITAVGSPNETVPGLSSNYEEITVHHSWRDELGYVDQHVRSFERIWNNERTDVFVRELDAEFALEVLAAVGAPATASPAPVKSFPSVALAATILEEARKSPSFWPVNSGPVAFFPHQERAILDSLERWPVRVMLSDEVGLGKTLEAGGLISYLHRFAGVANIMVLAPAGLLRQWRDELLQFFGLTFWIYDSAARAFESPTLEMLAADTAGPLSRNRPPLTLVSAQLARGSRRRGHIFVDAESAALPDLIVVDEAHAARVRRGTDGVRRPTLLWRALEEIAQAVPHFVLVTATPMQIEAGEYHASLRLLGLPTRWEEPSRYSQSLSMLASGERYDPSLQEARDAADLIRSSVTTYNWIPRDCTLPASTLVDAVRSTDTVDASLALRARADWPATYELLVQTHPAHLLTIRNSRASLERLGYKFPDRSLQAPIMDISLDIKEFYADVAHYLDESYGSLERALDPERRQSLGFAKSTYYQRLASTLHACRLSLQRRLARIEAIVAREASSLLSASEDDDESEWDEEDPVSAGPDTDWALVRQSAGVEVAYIKDLLVRLDRIEENDQATADPKVRELVRLVEHHTGKGKAVLVFSRYTDTLDGCLNALEDHFVERMPPHALFTGGEAWVDKGKGRVPATKHEIKKALDSGAIALILCSDAASEGLNLQSASVMVNVDVPWNPARLEQRIGRIARLGQQADTVTIYNLWYPDSVEAKMYTRLLARKDLYELAVGEFPEILSGAIKRILAGQWDSQLERTTDPLDDLQRMRHDAQHQAIRRIWNVEREPVPGSEELRGRLLNLVTDADSHDVTTSAGGDDSLWLSHASLTHLRRYRPSEYAGLDAQLTIADIEGLPTAFVVETSGICYLLPTERLPDILASALGGPPLSLDGDDALPDRTDVTADEVLKKARWLPDYEAMTTLSAVSPTPPGSQIEFRQLGPIRVALVTDR